MERREAMRAVISVLGKDRPGIIARVSAALAGRNVNILDISQTVLRDEIFAMTMLADMANMEGNFRELKETLDGVSEEIGMQIRLQREEVFKSMHRV
jgi:ACT domain-containing protein